MKQNAKISSNPPRALSSVVGSIEVSAIKQLELYALSKPDVVSLAQGTPSFFTPDHIKEAATEAMKKGLTDKYTPGYGIEPLRVAIVEKLKKQNNIHVQPSQVMVTHGAIEACMAVFMTLLNPNDEVLMPTPNYASHVTQIKIALLGRSPTYVPMDETKDGWSIDLEKIKRAITPNTKAIIICNPSNPLGKIYSKEELEAIANIAIQHNLYIIADEMYEDLVYDGKKHISIGSFPEVFDRTISIFGVSKSYAMTGWRIGYLATSQELFNQIFKIHDSLVTCPTAISQYAAIAALNGPKDVVWEFKKEYEKRRKITVDALKSTDKLQVSTPEGAYYILPKIKKPVDDVALAMEMVDKAGVAVVPGSAFGKGGENHIRIAYGCEEEQLRKGLDRFVSYINKHL